MRQLEAELTSNDDAALTALAGAGHSLQSRAAALEDEAQRIKIQFGLAR